MGAYIIKEPPQLRWFFVYGSIALPDQLIGFADIVFLPLPSVSKPAFIVELKYDKTARSALQQIKDRQYTQALEGYSGEILLVGINYNEEKAKPHSCVIERHSKI